MMTSHGGVRYMYIDIACDEEVYDPQTETWNETVTFVDCIAFREVADIAGSLGLTTGTKVTVTGRLEMSPRSVPGTDVIYQKPTIVLSDIDSAEPRERPWKADVWRNRLDS